MKPLIHFIMQHYKLLSSQLPILLYLLLWIFNSLFLSSKITCSIIQHLLHLPPQVMFTLRVSLSLFLFQLHLNLQLTQPLHLQLLPSLEIFIQRSQDPRLAFINPMRIQLQNILYLPYLMTMFPMLIFKHLSSVTGCKLCKRNSIPF